MKKPELSGSLANKELEKVDKQFEEFDKKVKDLTLDRMNEAPVKNPTEQQIKDKKEVYLKPKRTIGPGVHPKTGEREKFNERYREDYEFAKQYVCFTAYNNEIIGENIEIWTKPFPGVNTEEWSVPVNKPVWGPRYLAEQIKRGRYHKLIMKQTPTENNYVGQFYGHLIADETVQRIDAQPYTERKSIFMGSNF